MVPHNESQSQPTHYQESWLDRCAKLSVACRSGLIPADSRGAAARLGRSGAGNRPILQWPRSAVACLQEFGLGCSEDTISGGKCVLDDEIWVITRCLLNKSVGGIIEDYCDYPGFIMTDSVAGQNTNWRMLFANISPAHWMAGLPCCALTPTRVAPLAAARNMRLFCKPVLCETVSPAAVERSPVAEDPKKRATRHGRRRRTPGSKLSPKGFSLAARVGRRPTQQSSPP
jgi:hypothetical protein